MTAQEGYIFPDSGDVSWQKKLLIEKQSNKAEKALQTFAYQQLGKEDF